MPSAVTVRRRLTVPALLMRTSRRRWPARKSAASFRIDACEEKSQSSDSAAVEPDRSFTSANAAAVFAGSRPIINNSAPAPARTAAASRPMPLVAPVTRTVLRSMESATVAPLLARRRLRLAIRRPALLRRGTDAFDAGLREVPLLLRGSSAASAAEALSNGVSKAVDELGEEIWVLSGSGHATSYTFTEGPTPDRRTVGVAPWRGGGSPRWRKTSVPK